MAQSHGREKALIMDESAVNRTLVRLSHQIIEANSRELENMVFIGIQRRGVPMAQRFVQLIQQSEGIEIPLGVLDITLYRDDLSELAEHPQLNNTDIPFAVARKTVVMVDDVLYTGRTARAAMDALIDLGRPRSIQLACLVDRGHRELPIRADFVGKNIPTSKSEVISVCLREIDGEDKVVILERA